MTNSKLIVVILAFTVFGIIIGFNLGYFLSNTNPQRLNKLPRKYNIPKNITEFIAQLEELNIDYYEKPYIGTESSYYVPYELILRVAYNSGFITYARQYDRLLLETVYDGVVFRSGIILSP